MTSLAQILAMRMRGELSAGDVKATPEGLLVQAKRIVLSPEGLFLEVAGGHRISIADTGVDIPQQLKLGGSLNLEFTNGIYMEVK